MIRMVLALFAFAVALCAYIINASGPMPAPRVAEVAPSNEVTRAPTETLFQGSPLPVVAPTPTPEPTARIDERSLLDTAHDVLAQLGLKIRQPSARDTGDLAGLSAETLAAIGAVTGDDLPLPGPTDDGLSQLVAEALLAGRADAAIDSLVNNAVLSGRVSVPAVMVAPSGRIDTQLLLDTVISEARLAVAN